MSRSRSTLEYLDPNTGGVKYSYVPWSTLNDWLSVLNENRHVQGPVPEGVNRGKVIDELELRRNGSVGVVAVGSRLIGRDLGNSKDWREFENSHGYTHLEELLVYQPKEWRKQVREYMFTYNYDLNRMSTSKTRTVQVTVAPNDYSESAFDIHISNPILVVLFHLDLHRCHRYEPLNFLLAYGVTNPLPFLLENTIISDAQTRESFLEDLSPLLYFFDFQKAVQSFKLDTVRAIGQEKNFPRLCLIQELDFSNIIGQRIAKHIVRDAVVQHIWNRNGMSQGRHGEMLQVQQPLSFMFAGPSGIGKTELAHHLATLMNKPEDDACFIKVDCGKLSDANEMFGMSGPYYGAEEGSALNNFILNMSEKSDSLGIALLDEIDKARTNVIHGLYQVLDKGEWTNKKLVYDKTGQTSTISCSNIIFIMTTNAADARICELARNKPEVYTASNQYELDKLLSSMDKDIRQNLQRTHPFTPAFMGRVGYVVPFFPMARAVKVSSSRGIIQATDDAHPLMGEMMTVAKILIEREQNALVSPMGSQIKTGVVQFMSAATKDDIARIVVEDCVPESGVRAIQKGVTAKMGKRMRTSLLLERGGIQDGSTVRYSASLDEKMIDFRVESNVPECDSDTLLVQQDDFTEIAN